MGLADRGEAMNEWLTRVADNWRGGKFDACEAIHPGLHETIVVTAQLLQLQTVEFEVFNWERYANTTGYCPGDDDVSKSIAMTGNYERPEGKFVCEVLTPGRAGVVIDIGCHVGWYSMMAALNGYDVLCVDADTEHLRVLYNNAARLHVTDHITPVRGWIGPDTVEIPTVDAQRVRLLKADIEGLENEAVRICAPLFERGMIDYALIEISPVMADHYADTMLRIMNCGYAAFVLPGSADEDTYGDRLGTEGLHERVASWHQYNVVFVRDGLP